MNPNPLTFSTIKSGTMGYFFNLVPVSSRRSFQIFLGNSGILGGATGTPLLGFSGASGKLYDNDGNYIYSYKTEGISISGHVFNDHHAYYINSQPVNFNCSRETGDLNQLLITGLPLPNVTAILRGTTESCI